MDKMVKAGKYILGAFGVLIVIGMFMPSTPSTASKTEIKPETAKSESVAEKVVKSVWDNQASNKAESYLRISGFSRNGLIQQLEYEGFTKADATQAVDFLSINWNEQAVRKAASYLNVSSFSKSGLTQQLKYEGFTASEAVYGVENVG